MPNERLDCSAFQDGDNLADDGAQPQSIGRHKREVHCIVVARGSGEGSPDRRVALSPTTKCAHEAIGKPGWFGSAVSFTVAGELRVSAFPSVAASLIPRTMRAMANRFPDLATTFDELEPMDGLAALRA